MTMQETLVTIVEHCLSMDRLAVTVYESFARQAATDPALAAFWQETAEEERGHVEAWTDLLGLVLDREIPRLFPHPERTLAELAEHHARVRALSLEQRVPPGAAEQFLAAFRLEFYLMHPALERLWELYALLRDDGRNPARDYEAHVRRLANAVAAHGAASPELELLGESVVRLWNQLRELSHEASVDVLTRLLNRRGLASHMTLLAYLARRNRFTAGALMVDVDNFKAVNDTHGHQVGDEVLVGVARAIAGSVRRSDLVGRYGGEEFLVFLPQVDRGGVRQIAEKVRVSVETATRAWIPATVSVGAAVTDFADGVEPGLDALIRTADRRLFLAKEAGRNRVVDECP